MVTGNGYEEQTRRLLAETKSELNTIETEIAELQDKRVTLAREVNAYETALQGYLRRMGKQKGAEFNWNELLRGDKTHKLRLITIAKHNGGKIRVNQATDILYSNGFIKSKKRATAYVMIQGYLASMMEEGTFEKIAPGEYRLLGAQENLLS